MSKRKSSDFNKENVVSVKKLKPTEKTLSCSSFLNDKAPLNNATSSVQGMIVEPPYKLFKSLLKNCEPLADFLICGQAHELPLMTGLFVKDIGYISTPLTMQQARQIVNLYRGYRERKTFNKYEIGEKFIEIRNSKWNVSLQALADRVGKQMGVADTRVEAKFNKIILYKNGERRPLTKKAPVEVIGQNVHKFATLVIQLPSDFIGGEITVSNGSSKREFDFGQNSKKDSLYSIHFAAHSPEVKCDMNPVTGGHRLFLVYSLFCKKEKFISNLQLEKKSQIDVMLDCMKSLSHFKSKVSFLLEEHYEKLSLKASECANVFKGLDSKRFELLKHVNSLLPVEKQFAFFLVHLERHKSIDQTDGMYYGENTSRSFDESYDDECLSTDHDFDEDEGDELYDEKKITEWYDLNSLGLGLITSSLPFSHLKNFFDVNSNRMDNITEFLDDFTNWGKHRKSGTSCHDGAVSKNFNYDRYALALFPKSKLFKSLLDINFHSAVSFLHKSYLDTSTLDYEKFIEILNRFPKNISTPYNYKPVEKECYSKSVEKVFDILLTTNKVQLAVIFIEKLGTNLRKICEGEVVAKLAGLIVQHGWSALADSLGKVLQPINMTNLAIHLDFVHVSRFINSMLAQIGPFLKVELHSWNKASFSILVFV